MYWKNSYIFLVQKLWLNILSNMVTNANIFLHIVQNTSTSNIWIFSPFNSYGCLFPPKFLEFLVPRLLIASYSILFSVLQLQSGWSPCLSLACKPSTATQYTQEKLESPWVGIQALENLTLAFLFNHVFASLWHESSFFIWHSGNGSTKQSSSLLHLCSR